MQNLFKSSRWYRHSTCIINKASLYIWTFYSRMQLMYPTYVAKCRSSTIPPCVNACTGKLWFFQPLVYSIVHPAKPLCQFLSRFSLGWILCQFILEMRRADCARIDNGKILEKIGHVLLLFSCRVIRIHHGGCVQDGPARMTNCFSSRSRACEGTKCNWDQHQPEDYPNHDK